jgi:SAM-dependent methyltransferase
MHPEAVKDILTPGIRLDEVEPGIFSVLPPDRATNSFDKAGALAFYDTVACNPVYNRIMWGYWPSTLHAFCADLLGSAKGWFLDAGCGSLAFTAREYAGTDRPLILADQSLTLLRKAGQRLAGTNHLLLQADATALPFRDGVFDTVMSMNILHVLPDLGAPLAEAGRVLSPRGTAGFTTLLATGRWSDGYLRMWAEKGEMFCRDEMQLQAAFTSEGMRADIRMRGNMSFTTTDGNAK